MKALLGSPFRWLLSLLVVSGLAAVLVAGPVIAGGGGSATKIVKRNTGIFYALIGRVHYGVGFQNKATVGSLSLPPGAYAVSADPTVTPFGNSTNALQQCQLLVNGNVADTAPASPGHNEQAKLSLLAAIRLTQRGSVSVVCYSGAIGGSGESETGWIIATRAATYRQG